MLNGMRFHGLPLFAATMLAVLMGGCVASLDSEEESYDVDSAQDALMVQRSDRWRDIHREGSRRGFHATSTYGGHHNPGSAHYEGRAVDFRSRDHTWAEGDRFIREMRGLGYHVIDERDRGAGRVWSGPHIHVEDRRR